MEWSSGNLAHLLLGGTQLRRQTSFYVVGTDGGERLRNDSGECTQTRLDEGAADPWLLEMMD